MGTAIHRGRIGVSKNLRQKEYNHRAVHRGLFFENSLLAYFNPQKYSFDKNKLLC